MIISVPLSLLHMLLVGAPTTANAAFQSNNFARFRQTRLFAEDPYASLLNKVAPTTSDVATTAVTTPSPEPMLNAVDAQEKMNDIIQQINEAASSAMDAADKADQAAASIAVPAAAIKSAIAANVSAVAAAKAAAVAKAKEAAAAKAAAKAAAIAAAGSTGQTEKVPTLFEYITKLGSNESVDSGAANLAEMQEKLSLLKSNLIDGFSSLGNAPGVSNIKFPVVGAGTAAGVTYSSPDIQGLVENLHLEQYGAWYVTAVSLLYASGQRQAGKEAAEKLFEEELTNAKLSAEEAAAAAALAAEGAKAAKDLVKNMPKVPTDNKILMESKLAQIALEKVSLCCCFIIFYMV
jgi:hypothetical protein